MISVKRNIPVSKVMVCFLALSIVSGNLASAQNSPAGDASNAVIEDFIPEIAGLDLHAVTDPAGQLPAALLAVVERKNAEQKLSPGWVKDLQKKTLSQYFPNLIATSTESDLNQGKQDLLLDSAKLFKYYESDNTDSRIYKQFVSKRLTNFIGSITLDSLKSVHRKSQIAAPMSTWTVESLVVREQIVYLGHFPNVIKNTMNLVTGPHFKGATVIAGLLATTAVAIYTGQILYHLSPIGVGIAAGSFVGNMFFTAFKSSTLAGPLNSLLDCIFGPTNEFIGTLASRRLGGVRRVVNNFYDKLKVKPNEKGVESRTNDSPNYPDPVKDNMTFAGMTKAEQDQNWDKCLRMWNGVQSTFGQLLRGNHHAGRSLMMIAWSDEQITKILVETMDSKLILYATQAETRLQVYKNLILGDQTLSSEQKMAKIAEFLDHYDLYQSLNEKVWLDLALSADEIAQLNSEVTTHLDFLSKHLMKRDLDYIIEIQENRREAIRTLFTGLTLNEIRSYMVAEANRNLDAEARLAQRAIRRGFQLQNYVESYQNHIQLVMQEMGFKNELKLTPAHFTCEDIFVR